MSIIICKIKNNSNFGLEILIKSENKGNMVYNQFSTVSLAS